MKPYKPKQKPVTPADAEQAMFGAEAARTRMFERYGIMREKYGANAARDRMIERHSRHGEKSPERAQERRTAARVKSDRRRAVRAFLTMQRIF